MTLNLSAYLAYVQDEQGAFRQSIMPRMTAEEIIEAQKKISETESGSWLEQNVFPQLMSPEKAYRLSQDIAEAKKAGGFFGYGTTAEYVANLEEGEKIFRYSVSVCRNARIFLSAEKDYLEESLGLKVNVRQIAEKLSITLPRFVVEWAENSFRGIVQEKNPPSCATP